MDKKLVEAFVLEYKQKQELKEIFNANHIKIENYFNYSGKNEEDTEQWKEYVEAQTYAAIKARPRDTSRKEYFRKYWLKYKLNQI